MTQNIPAISIADFLKCIRERLDEAAAIAKAADSRPFLVGEPEQIPAHRSFPQNESMSYCPTTRINEFWP
jgi:hypothetical protein